jgi:UDP-N-acetylglucosamine--N-acetylmuramyl-(pentapeptide) pyrophosphoryl-undecaprenol N-acetylglucosamine transferase
MSKKKNNPVVVFVGGGSGGALLPLFPLASAAQEIGITPIFFVSKDSFTQKRMKDSGFSYVSIFAGKLRRYFSLKNFVDVFVIITTFFQALYLLSFYRVSAVISIGSYVAVPVIWAAWILRIPRLIHQQDVVIGLANRLCIPFATTVTVSVAELLKSVPEAEVVGHPIRPMFYDPGPVVLQIERRSGKRLLLVIGGGTGARALNAWVLSNIDTLVLTCDVVHLTGEILTRSAPAQKITGYHRFDFIAADILAAIARQANLVITRAGFGSLSEFSVLAKAMILVPLPRSPQERNAALFERHGAARVISENLLDTALFPVFSVLMQDAMLRREMGQRAQQLIMDATPQLMTWIKKHV